MRSDKQLLILLILLVMTTAVGLVFFQQEPGPKGQENTAVLVTNFRMGEVQGLVLKNEAGTMALINTPGGVILEGEEAHPYAQDKLKTLIYTVSHLTARRQLDSDSTRSEEFGTENPLAQASILLPESTIRLRLGRQNPISGEYYLSVEGRDSFYMIDSETAGLMLQTARDMREFSLYPPLTQESISDIIQIKITNRKGSFAIGPMPSASGSNFFGLLAPVEVMLDWERVNSRILTPLWELCPETFVSDDIPLKEYGLDQPDSILELTMDDGTYRIGFVQKDPDTWYCADLDGTLVCRISAPQTAFLQGEFWDLIGNSLYSKSTADISRIFFKYSDASLILEISGEGAGLTGTVNGLQLERQELLDFYKKVESIPAVEVLDGSERTAPEPLLTISVTFRNGGKDILEFYTITKRQCAVYINGAAEFSTYTGVVEDIVAAARSLKQKSENP